MDEIIISEAPVVDDKSINGTEAQYPLSAELLSSHILPLRHEGDSITVSKSVISLLISFLILITTLILQSKYGMITSTSIYSVSSDTSLTFRGSLLPINKGLSNIRRTQYSSSPAAVAAAVSSRMKVAYAITITQDGSFQDGAAVLAYSIMKFSNFVNYDVSLVAFVHPHVVDSRIPLKKLGYHVIECMTPINSSAITFNWFREHIDKNGCCGSSELIKLNAYRLTQYDRVIHLDADVILLNPIDELLAKNYSLIYTTDPNMASHKGDDKMPVQGGFIVIQPSMTDYYNLINIMMSVDFLPGGGWNGSKIGWFWGGMTVQGVLPYYYNLITTPGRSLKVDRCYFNTMADVPECLTQDINELKSAHFTVCQKPWKCVKGIGANKLCKKMHEKWFELRKEAESYYGMKVCDAACPGRGYEMYQLMDLSHAIIPANHNFIVDSSPDILLPIGNSGYVSLNLST